MNWRRGFLRVWILITAAWVLLTGAYELNRWNDYFGGIRSLRTECRNSSPPPWCLDWSQLPPTNYFDRFDQDRPKIPGELALVAAPPLALLLCALAVGWAIGGFRKPT
jgi:hypothetical protein